MKVGVGSGLCHCGFLEPWFSLSGCDGECFAPYWAALDQENEKDNVLEFSCLSIVRQHKEIVENDVKSASLVTLNRLFSWFEIRGDLRSFERSPSLEGLRGAPRCDPGVTQRWFQESSKIMIFHQNLMKMMSFCGAFVWKSRPHADGFQWNLVRSKFVDGSSVSEKMVCRRFN